MITTVLIIAVAIIAVLTAYGWWKTNEIIAYEVQRRLQNYDYFCEKYNNLKCDVEHINDLLNSANDRIKIVTRLLDDFEDGLDYLHDRLLTHCHAYNVENNTLYIQNPLWIDNTKEPKAIEKNEEGQSGNPYDADSVLHNTETDGRS